MKIAVAGKGGSGKTTISGTLARLIAKQQGLDNMLAIDGDSNPNLATTLGLSPEQMANMVPVPRSIVERVFDDDGKASLVLAMEPDNIIERYGVATPDRVSLLQMAGCDQAGAG